MRVKLTSAPRCLGAGVLCVLIAAPILRADAIVVTQAMTASTIAEIFIEERVARVELEIGAQDLPAFHNLMPDAINERLGFEPEPLAERLPRFFREDLVVRADGVGPRRDGSPRSSLVGGWAAT